MKGSHAAPDKVPSPDALHAGFAGNSGSHEGVLASMGCAAAYDVPVASLCGTAGAMGQ